MATNDPKIDLIVQITKDPATFNKLMSDFKSIAYNGFSQGFNQAVTDFKLKGFTPKGGGVSQLDFTGTVGGKQKKFRATYGWGYSVEDFLSQAEANKFINRSIIVS